MNLAFGFPNFLRALLYCRRLKPLDTGIQNMRCSIFQNERITSKITVLDEYILLKYLESYSIQSFLARHLSVLNGTAVFFPRLFFMQTSKL
jgi:hypothetical protein